MAALTIVKLYIPNNKVPKSMKQNLTDLEEEIDDFIIIVGDFKTFSSVVEWQKINKEIENLNNIFHAVSLMQTNWN